MGRSDAVAEHAASRFEETVSRLCEYLRIPAISCEPAHAGDVRALAGRIRDDLDDLGFERARVLELPGALPAVAAEWMQAGPGKPVVLVYGHLDLQPVAGERWDTPPHEPTRRGDRLYARGAADDMGGWVSHLASLEAWLAVESRLPVNLKLLIEGEEEIGSPSLARYMDAFPEAFEADVMILTDCDNPSTEIPGLTVSLRGVVELEVTVEALEVDIHSGLWGNVVPDVSLALVRILARLTDEDGRLAVGRVPVDPAWRQKAWTMFLDAARIREGAHLLPGIDPLPDREIPPAEWNWRQPAATVLATTLPTPDRMKNALRARASAVLSLRVAPGQSGEDLASIVGKVLLADPPGGVRVSVTRLEGSGESWLYEPKGPAFDAADRAYRKAWGRPPARIGVGGSIPFVSLFAERYPDLPLILNGVIDPLTTAHGPNESLHLDVFRRTIAANIHLYEELGSLRPAELRETP